jgi:uncharacterized protein (TIGR02266 family)
LVQFRFNSLEEFLAEYSVDLSPTGIFIHSDEVPEVDAAVYLQFSLADGSRLIEGLGRVARVVLPGGGRPASGFAVQFVDFDEESLAFIRRLCEGRPQGPTSG